MLRVKPTIITLTHTELKEFERRLRYRYYLGEKHGLSVSHGVAHSSDSHLPTDACSPELTVGGEHDLATPRLNDRNRWRFLGSEPSSENPEPISAHDIRSSVAFDQRLPRLRTMRRGESIHRQVVIAEDDTGAVVQSDAPRRLQGSSEELPNRLQTFDLPLRSAVSSPISTPPRTPAETGQSNDMLHSRRRHFLPHADGTPADYDVGSNPANPLTSHGPQVQPRVGHAMPIAHSPSAQVRGYRRRTSTPDSPRAARTRRPHSAEGIRVHFDTRVATSREIPVYNDGGSTTEQPQTPRHLPEARHQSRFDGSYTAPVRERRERTVAETTSVDGRGSQARRAGSPSGLQRPGFEGLYGGIENAEEDWPVGDRHADGDTMRAREGQGSVSLNG
ncbi:hypothetical protein B0J13DRAFT_91604 [Dactylonectria estremocensis]|uniref:Uncharacterized protein n=1 Tax=Dactylonectria estremocensis TaxID=1079267 RepID=A0A9P9IV96_9HYPO|nr:hypothetical protein B0J13DRAFT_91604 [Dactylonectria estremocensis]